MSACVPIGSVGWKPTSFTDPACPGNLYSIRRDVVSQMYRYLSPEPADILLPSGDQAHLNRFYNEVYSCSFKFLDKWYKKDYLWYYRTLHFITFLKLCLTDLKTQYVHIVL